jgi:type I restriction enzyme S subunit
LCLELKPTFLNLASGGAVTLNMNTSTFKSLKVINPKSDILESFHKRVETIFEQILNLQIESENLSNIRDTLLPKLISGELEVNESLLEPTF